MTKKRHKRFMADRQKKIVGRFIKSGEERGLSPAMSVPCWAIKYRPRRGKR